MNIDQLELYRIQIRNLTQLQMARLWRFAPVGHPYFDRRFGLLGVFQERFLKLGGFTSQISKQIGW